jgi:hypothetical protein
MTSARDRAALLVARREALLAVAQAHRDLLSADARSLEPSLRWIELGRNAWLFARDHPWLAALPLAALALVRPRWAWRAAGTTVALLRLGRWMR